MPQTQTEELLLPLTPEGATNMVGSVDDDSRSSSKTEELLLPLSPLDAMMHKLGVMLLYIFPRASSSAGYDLARLQTSLVALVDEDYPILIGELHLDQQTGVVSVKQTAEARQRGARGLRFEANPSSSMTTEDAMKTLSWELMPTPRAPTELVCVKGTLLADGGLVVGVDASHTLLDGEGMFTFMTAWGQHYSEVSKQKRLVINHDRHLLGGTGSPSKLLHPEFQVVGIQPAADIVNAEAAAPPPTAQHRFHFTPNMLKRIKEVATRGEPAVATSDVSYVSTIDAVTGLFTSLISQARGHGQDNYAGNVIFSALSSYKSDELKAGNDSDGVVSPDSLVELAQRVRGSIRHSDDEYLRDAIDFIARQSNLSAVQPATNFVFGPDTMNTSWVRTGMYDAEFEGMRPSLVSVPPLPLDGFVVMSEPPRNSPGVDVLVFLECTAMEKLKELFAQVAYLRGEDGEQTLRSTL
ncbi:hypothetical protein PHYPSEUDO_013031 [Phytophthora pseudosyringae]|uniref:Uncharacterized protein n=1 Tax=Phytophthora pseudosyringae TaxID=221518 RepID=A0A8T1V934_9STRA|nr:hypothetical protein PHYPSEUDO_013031 [Phytophthora pseudosyringae]